MAQMPFVIVMGVAVVSFALAILIRMRQKRRVRDSEFWPHTEATIKHVYMWQPDNGNINEPYTVTVHYSYAVEGTSYSRRWTFRFNEQAEAVGVRDWLTHSTTFDIAYDSQTPNVSVPKLPAIAPAVLPQKEPQPLGTTRSALCSVLLLFALSGCAVSGVINLGAWLGHTYPMWLMIVLHLGVFVVFPPAAALVSRRVGSAKNAMTDLVADTGGKNWFAGLLSYAIINFFAALAPAIWGGHSAISQVMMWRAFSGHWLALYGVAALLLHALLTHADILSGLPGSQPS
jgi:Protein of unknown function (DUF3592)